MTWRTRRPDYRQQTKSFFSAPSSRYPSFQRKERFGAGNASEAVFLTSYCFRSCKLLQGPNLNHVHTEWGYPKSRQSCMNLSYINQLRKAGKGEGWNFADDIKVWTKREKERRIFAQLRIRAPLIRQQPRQTVVFFLAFS